MANSKILDQLRADMPKDVKYVTVERCPNVMALDVFFLVAGGNGPAPKAEQWRVARKVDYEALHRPSGVRMFWDAISGKAYEYLDGGFSITIEDTDDEPPKRWAAANNVAQSLLTHFKLGKEFCEHKGWDFHTCVTLTLAEQESMAGEILEFIKPLLMKEADVPLPRRLPLPTVACLECGAGVEVRRHKEKNGFASVMIDGHIAYTEGHFLVRCYKCPPKVGPIKCDSGPVDLSDVIAAKTSELEKVTKLPDPISKEYLERLEHDAMYGNGEGRPYKESASGGCTCGAWVTPGARHDDHCDLVE